MVTVTPFHGPCSWIRQWDRAPDPIPTYLHGGPRATETAIISEVLRRHTRVQSIPRRGRGPVVSPCSYGICRTPVRKLKIRQRYVRKKTLPVTGKRVSSINIVSNFRAFLFFLSFFFSFTDFQTAESKRIERPCETSNAENISLRRDIQARVAKRTWNSWSCFKIKYERRVIIEIQRFDLTRKIFYFSIRTREIWIQLSLNCSCV